MRFNNGLHQDQHESRQPDGTYPDARNMILDDERGALRNEQGTTLRGSLFTNFVAVGSTLLPNGNIVVFSRWLVPFVYDLTVSGTGDALEVNIDAVPYSTTDAGSAVATAAAWVTEHTAFLEALPEPITAIIISPAVIRLSSNVELTIVDGSGGGISFTESSAAQESFSEIGLFTGSAYSTIISDMGWATNNRLLFGPVIEATSRVNQQMNYVIYWTDDVNGPRYLNITTDPGTERGPDTFSLFPILDSHPDFLLDGVVSGGSLRSGTYHIALAYVNADLTPTNYFLVSPAIPVNEDTNESDPDAFDGAPVNTPTQKAIRFKLANIDTNYAKLRIALIKDAGVRVLPDVRLVEDDDGFFTYTITGNEAYTDADLVEITAPKAFYERARTLRQVDNRLYLGNLETLAVEFDYQKYANNIVVEAVEETFDGINGLGYKDPTQAFIGRSFRRDEVYALYISWVLKNGAETPAFHIPGRGAGSAYSNGYVKFSEAPTSIQPATAVLGITEPWSTYAPTTFTFYVDNWPVESAIVGDGDETYAVIVPSGYNAAQTIQYLRDAIFDYWQDLDVQVDPDNANQLIFSTRDNHEAWNAGASVYFYALPKGGLVGTTSYGPPGEFFAGGEDDEGQTIGTAQLTLYGETISHPIIGATSKTNMALELKALLEANATIAAAYTITLTGASNEKVVITANTPNDPSFNSTMTSTYGTYMSGVILYGVGGGADYWVANENELLTDLAGDPEVADLVAALGVPGGNFDDAKLFHVSGVADAETGMGYWENLNEFYPNSESGDIWDVDGNGVGYDSGRTLRNLNVRHHRFPEAGSSPFFEGTGTSNNFTKLGILLTNVKIPTELEDLVRGFKIYYAKRTTGNKTILDQDQLIYADIDPVATDSYTTQQNASDPLVGNGYEPLVGYLHPFNLMRTRGSLSQISFVKSAAQTTVSPLTDGRTGLGSYAVNPTPLVAEVVDIKYIEAGELQTALGGDFSQPYCINEHGESKIIIELGSRLDATVGSQEMHLINLHVLRLDVYTTYQTQDLVYTGYFQSDVALQLDPFTGAAWHGDNESGPIFGADTFICPYTYKAHWYDNVSAYDTASHDIVCESDDNIGLRHEGDEEWDLYYPKSPRTGAGSFEDPGVYPSGGVAQDVDNDFSYNPAYSSIQDFKVAIPELVDGTETVYNYPTRVARSGVDNGGASDSFRSFLFEDFLDFPKNRGELVHLASMGSTIIAHMTSGLFRTRGREEMVFGDVRAYIGSGDIFSVAPTEVITTDLGYGGLQDQRAAFVTSAGYFWVDREARRMLRLNEQGLADVTGGLTYWFEENLNNSTTLHVFEDTAESRMVLCGYGGSAFCLSMDLGTGNWISFHDYAPQHFLAKSNRFFSVKDEGIWEHFVGDYGRFYATVFSSYIEFIDNDPPALMKQVASMLIESVTQQAGVEDITKTFTSYRITNSYQDTGTVAIDTNVLFSTATGNARRQRGLWRMNVGRDTLNIPATAELRRYGTTQAYQKRLIDKWHKVRLTLNNTANDLLYLFHAQLVTRHSKR